jgi:serine/threonine protein kinase
MVRSLIVSPDDWKKAKIIQATMLAGTANFKINKRTADAEFSFLSIKSEKDQKQKLFAMANQGQILGRGAFGKVKLGMTEEGEFVAIKIQNVVRKASEPIQTNPDDNKEIQIEKKLSRYHGYLARRSDRRKIAGNKINDDEVVEKKYQVIDYLGVSLEQILYGKKVKDSANQDVIEISPTPLTVEQKKQIILGTLKAVSELHKQGIIHCDLHAGNILVSLEKKPIAVHIIDFGLAKQLDPGQSEIKVSSKEKINSNIMAPEVGRLQYDKVKNTKIVVHNHHPFFSEKTDVYALSLLFKNGLGLAGPVVERMNKGDYDKRPSAHDAYNRLKNKFDGTTKPVSFEPVADTDKPPSGYSYNEAQEDTVLDDLNESENIDVNINKNAPS